MIGDSRSLQKRSGKRRGQHRGTGRGEHGVEHDHRGVGDHGDLDELGLSLGATIQGMSWLSPRAIT